MRFSKGLNEEHFESLIEHATDVITVLNAAGVILFESPSVERVIGYKLEELIGQPALDFVHPDDVPSGYWTASASVPEITNASS